MPPILNTSHGELYGARLCAHARKTIPMAPFHSFTKQIIPSMYQKSLGWSRLISMARVFRKRLINSFLPSSLAAHRFLPFIFIAHFFRGLAGTGVNPGSFSHSLVCQITYSFLNGFQPNLCQHFSHACSTRHTIFSLK